MTPVLWYYWMCSDRPLCKALARWELSGCLCARWLCCLATVIHLLQQNNILAKRPLSENSFNNPSKLVPSWGTVYGLDCRHVCVRVCVCVSFLCITSGACEFFIRPVFVWFNFVLALMTHQTHIHGHTSANSQTLHAACEVAGQQAAHWPPLSAKWRTPAGPLEHAGRLSWLSTRVRAENGHHPLFAI